MASVQTAAIKWTRGYICAWFVDFAHVLSYISRKTEFIDTCSLTFGKTGNPRDVFVRSLTLPSRVIYHYGKLLALI